MSVERQNADIRIEFLKGDPENPFGMGYIYADTQDGEFLSVLATRNFRELKKRGLKGFSYVFDDDIRNPIWTGDVKVSTPAGIVGGVEDVLMVTNLGGRNLGTAVISAAVQYSSLLADKPAQVPRTRRYYEIDKSDLVTYMYAVFVKPMAYVIMTQNSAARISILDDLGRFSRGSPFQESADEMIKRFRTLARPPNIEALTTHLKLMEIEWAMFDAVENEQYEKAAKLRDTLKLLKGALAAKIKD